RAHGCALNEPRNPLAKSEGRMPGDRATGGVLSLVTFFAQAKKVTRSPSGRVEALHFERTTGARSWIPAFAGMTSKKIVRNHPHPTLPLKGRAKAASHRRTRSAP